jgi:hypothetical protein
VYFFSASTRKKANIFEDYSLLIGNNSIAFLESVRLLGVIIDDKLNFDCHISALCKKIASKVYLLKKSGFMYKIDFKVIYIQSAYEYCSKLFFFCSNNS